MPRTLGAYCPRATCRSDFAADVAAVANGLVQTPLSGSVRGSNHTITPVHVGAVDFLGLVVAADLDPGLAAELPAAVHAARTGYPQPLLRIYNLEEQSSDTGPTQISDALYMATVCRDGPFPWLPDTPIGDRPALAQAALAALPAGAFGPFAPWAAEIGNVDLCLGWPAPAGGTGIEASALPDVPVLAVSGGLDLRTPTANAAAVVARFPQGHLLVVPGVGHSVLSTDPSGCSQIAVRHWILTNAAPSPCRSARPYLQPVPTLAARAAKRLTPAQSLSLAANTLHEAEAVWLLAANASIGPVSGVVSGRLATNELGFNLSKYSDTAGLALSGRLTLTSIGAPVVFKGTVTVSGTAAKHGRLTVTSSGVHWRPGK
jgi:hypothetical protein